MKAKTIFLSLAVLAPLHMARAAMKLSVSMIQARDQLMDKMEPGTTAVPQNPQE